MNIKKISEMHLGSTLKAQYYFQKTIQYITSQIAAYL
jgi:hypothetical protein